MSKVRRLRLTDRIFFTTTNLRRHVAPLAPGEYPLLVRALEQSRARLHFVLCGYVLMPDHWHALMGITYPLTISTVIHEIRRLASRAINQARGSRGGLWQHQFWERFVRHAGEFNERLEYMHLNPVRKGLVSHPEEWPWSSYLNFALDRGRVARCPLQIDYVRLPDDYRG